MPPVRRTAAGNIEILHEANLNPTPEVPYRVVLRFAEAEGRAVCVNVEIGAAFREGEGADFDPEPITTSALRAIPLARLIDLALRTFLSRHEELDGDTPSSRFNRERKETLEAALRVKKRPGRPPLYGEDHYAKVATVYRQNSGGRAPTKAVSEHFQTTKSTAAKWVGRARELGLLEPATGTLAAKGEQTDA